MSALQVEFRVSPDRLEAAEARLFELGCQAISLVSDTDEPVLEPAPGETPLWDSVTMQAWFSLDTDFSMLRRGLHDALPGVELHIEFVGDQDWQANVNNHAVNEMFAQRLWLMPKDRPGQDIPAGVTPLYLEPGLAFGSGSHPTTHLCLDWLATNLPEHHQGAKPVSVLDFGCGSGILSVAAALLGAKVTAVDHDPQAVVAACENAEYNGVADLCEVLSLEQWQSSTESRAYEVVVANILAQPLIDLADTFESVCVGGASIVLSGILRHQVQDVVSAFANTDFSETLQREEWVRLQGVVRGHREQGVRK